MRLKTCSRNADINEAKYKLTTLTPLFLKAAKLGEGTKQF